MVPQDCEPKNDSEIVYEYLEGPDEKDRYIFFMYWRAPDILSNGQQTITRGQVFNSALRAEYQEAQRAAGKTVREIWR